MRAYRGHPIRSQETKGGRGRIGGALGEGAEMAHLYEGQLREKINGYAKHVLHCHGLVGK